MRVKMHERSFLPKLRRTFVSEQLALLNRMGRKIKKLVALSNGPHVLVGSVQGNLIKRPEGQVGFDVK